MQGNFLKFNLILQDKCYYYSISTVGKGNETVKWFLFHGEDLRLKKLYKCYEDSVVSMRKMEKQNENWNKIF